MCVYYIIEDKKSMIKYIDKYGTFQIKNPEGTNYLYFPIANENGVMSCVTPNLDQLVKVNGFIEK